MSAENLESATMDETYNGWKNYPTWAVNLWLTNDEGHYATVREHVDAPHEYGLDRIDLADYIKQFVREDLSPDLGASFAADLLGYALDQVDWLEIADAFLQD